MYRIDTKTAYNNLDNSLLCLKTHIENKDTYWFPTWTIKNALAQVEKDFAQMNKTSSLSKKQLTTLISRCSKITDLVNQTTKQQQSTSKIWNLFSLLFSKVTLSKELLAPVETINQEISKQYEIHDQAEKLAQTLPPVLTKKYPKKHLDHSVLFLLRRFPNANNHEEILKNTLSKIENLPEIEWKRLKPILKKEAERLTTPSLLDAPKKSNRESTEARTETTPNWRFLGIDLGGVRKTTPSFTSLNKPLPNPRNNCFMNAFLQDFCGETERFNWFCHMLELSSGEASRMTPAQKESAGKALSLLNTWKDRGLSSKENGDLRTHLSALCTTNRRANHGQEPPVFKEGPIYTSMTTQEDSHEFRSHLLAKIEENLGLRDQDRAANPWAIKTTKTTKTTWLNAEDINNPERRSGMISEKEIAQGLESRSVDLSSGLITTDIDRPIINNDIPIAITRNDKKKFVNIAEECLKLETEDPAAEADRTGKICEITTNITWPNTLLLQFKLFTIENDSKETKLEGVEYKFSESPNQDDFILNLNSSRNPCQYQLESFLVHSGSTVQSGHYYTFRRELDTEGNSRWVEYNDSTVRQVDNNRIIGLLNGSSGKETPYLMTFKKI